MVTEDQQVPHVGADDKDLSAGDVVGDYVVAGKIGEGGFGTVFRAEHPVIGKQVAIKVLGRQYSADPAMVSRFVAEARAVNQIRHRNIIDIFGFGQLPDGRHYYVMEFLEGQPLDVYLAARGRLSLAEAIPILRAVALALDAAHSKGIAHRDLKPENVFMAFDELGSAEVKLLDFGIAKLLHTAPEPSFKTRTGAPMGTPFYMSPEQCRGRDVDHRTDIYAFGCVTYRVLTGAYPFDGPDFVEILLKQTREEPVPASRLVAALPSGVDDIISWMLRKQPDERPPDLSTAVRALERAAAAGGVAVATGAGAIEVSGDDIAVPAPTPRPGVSGAELTGAAVADTLGADTGSVPGRAPPVGAVGALNSGVDLEGDGQPPARSGAEQAEARGPGRRVGVWIGLAALVALVVAAGGYAVMHRHGADRGAAGSHPPARAAAPGQGGAAPGAAVGEAAKASGPAGATASGQPGALSAPAAQSAGAPSAAAVAPAAAGPGPGSADRFAEFEITGTPDGTEVYGPAGPVGMAPGKIQLPRGTEPVLLTFQAAGYRPVTRQVVPSKDGSLEVSLTRLTPKSGTVRHPRPHHPRRGHRTGRPAHDPNSVEDPFGQGSGG